MRMQLHSRYFLLRGVPFQIIASYPDYLHPVPSDLLGEETETSENRPQGIIWIINAPWAPSAAASSSVLFLSGQFPANHPELRARLGVQVASKFIMRRLEDFNVYHAHASAVYFPHTGSMVALVGSPKSGKSLLALLLASQEDVRLVCNSFLPYSVTHNKLQFFRGPSRWLVRTEVVRTAEAFFQGRNPIWETVIPTLNNFLDSEVQLAYDISNRLIERSVVTAQNFYLVWPELARIEGERQVSVGDAENMLDRDIVMFMTLPNKPPGGILPDGWNPSMNPNRRRALKKLAEMATTRINMTGTPLDIHNRLLRLVRGNRKFESETQVSN